MIRPLLLLLTLMITPFLSQASGNDLLGALGISQAPRFLKVDEAFRLDSHQEGNQLTLTLTIADDYYLYRHRFAFQGEGVTIAPPTLPAGTPHEDDFFGKSQVYYQEVSIPVTLTDAAQGGQLRLSYQGCTEGLCYPPTERLITITPVAAAEAAPLSDDPLPLASEQEQLADQLSHQGLWLSVAAFFALGLGLALTPCMFPMYPILTGIIAGSGTRLSTGRAFALSLAYVQGMAVTYTLLGLVVASAGLQFQAALQAPVVLITLSLLFVLLALSMFGLYTLQLPSALQTRLAQLSNRQQGGSLIGVTLMGAISGLVCSPCTTAPLSGALLYVAQSGDMLLGAAALYALSLGMGLPLLLLGTSGGRLLPKAGAWMDRVKQLFGFALLAVPLLLLSRLWGDQVSTLAWIGWALLLCGYLYHHNQQAAAGVWRNVRGFVLLLAMMGALLLAYDSWRAAPVTAQTQPEAPQFVRIKTHADLVARLKEAHGKPVLLDLYADWCVACKEFEHKTFSDPAVRRRFADMVLLQADVTANDDDDVTLLNDLKVLGLPTLILFDRAGNEVKGSRITGFMGPQPFAERLDRVIGQ
ncbi:protein-disulfide reductase DsbD [Aeromonas simiae]|uniref:Thiol:disulfide interchange protein DsbD n=1 Tax=Aeromonas simiae TaxID=218936 RepID=A0A5J6X0F3_9GAMM|nr:protein-disulfide reductase DsbD [Aeromonas simiae]QFI55658.1 protein-disulfide reductase DsbD [Aeromonas simiae]